MNKHHTCYQSTSTPNEQSSAPVPARGCYSGIDVELDESIASTLATLHELKIEREELHVKETDTRKRRLEILQCLQGATFGVQESPPELMLPGQNTAYGAIPPYVMANANPVCGPTSSTRRSPIRFRSSDYSATPRLRIIRQSCRRSSSYSDVVLHSRYPTAAILQHQ